MKDWQIRDEIDRLRSEFTTEINYVRDDLRRLQQEVNDLRRHD